VFESERANRAQLLRGEDLGIAITPARWRIALEKARKVAGFMVRVARAGAPP
jgi:hypothetical protein